MRFWNTYVLAHSIEEALDILSHAPGSALPVAGGTDLLLEIQQGEHEPVHTLVDITHIPELKRLEETEDHLFIGAAVPVSRVAESPLVRHHATAVAEACSQIGGPQVRNSATLGGNVAHALPAADGMIALLALDARAEVASLEGRRLEPMENLFKGPGQTALDLRREILVGFHVPLRRLHQASAFGRVMRPQGVALPILNTAVWVERHGEVIGDIRVAIGPSGPVPRRASAVEAVLRGQPCDQETFAAARRAIRESIRFRSSPLRASAEYRYHLSGVLLEEVVIKAWQRTLEPSVVEAV
ncbi:xanthine dehydrogenase family protein subunit M [uncultured Thermanaerothrix sp.]|uniref:FAD binding domain-containing protein n=1 Tax=uncultured Thermanaerothrix sp. TaxID=1195149 RepID=UPI00260DF52B|nr:xanthine dehydrogenase family protein subunit M [uncultured Thermanaerothrix sp.]